jgi:hypothetical protein
MKCVALVPCEKIIIDKDGAHSLITVMIKAGIALRQEVAEDTQKRIDIPIPDNAMIPSQWWIYSIWEPSSRDIGTSFEQVYQVYWPNGDKLAERRLQKFIQNDDTMMQTSFVFVGLPVGQVGKIKILTWLDSDGHRVSEIAETSIQIKHFPTTQEASTVT